jgi:hypothetical protein
VRTKERESIRKRLNIFEKEVQNYDEHFLCAYDVGREGFTPRLKMAAVCD